MKLNIPGTEIVGLIMLLVPPVFAADYRRAFPCALIFLVAGRDSWNETPALGCL